jgi:hypothetical protein
MRINTTYSTAPATAPISQPRLLAGRIFNSCVESSHPTEMTPDTSNAVSPTLFHPPSF